MQHNFGAIHVSSSSLLAPLRKLTAASLSAMNKCKKPAFAVPKKMEKLSGCRAEEDWCLDASGTTFSRMFTLCHNGPLTNAFPAQDAGLPGVLP